MNLDGKQDLDALLKSWPAPVRNRGAAANEQDEQDEEGHWEARSEAIVRAALASKQEAASPNARDALGALLAAPDLTPEPGEEAELSARSLSAANAAAAGEKKMSQEKEPGESSASTATPPPTERKRTSLKEIAARASQSGARLGSPGTATPAPSSVAPSGRTSTSTSTPLPRPVEAGKEDSGVINLDVVRASVTAQQVAAAEKAKPATAGLFEDEKTAVSAEDPAAKPRVVRASSVAVVKAKKNNTGPIVGMAIAVLGIAAAFGIMTRKPHTSAPMAVTEKTSGPIATVAPTASTLAVAPADPTAASATSEADSKPADTAKVAVAGPLNGGPVATAKDAPTASADPRVAAKTTAPPGKSGDLQSEMARAVGKDGTATKPEQTGPVPEPASGPKNQNVPEQPSQGAVAAAVGGVMGGAKACVAGADDVSRANVTFSSSGAVTSVSVTGWAAAHGKSSCVQAALKGAKVGPFSKSAYTVGMTIRP